MKKIMLSIAVLLLACIGGVQAGSVWTDYDAASPLLVRYINTSGTGTVTVAAGTVTVTDDGNANALSFSGSGTLADLYSHIVSATNASGDKNFQAVYYAGISGDSCLTNYLVTASATTITREWSRVLLWDTSNCKHYDCVVNAQGPDSSFGSCEISQILGEPTGTGNVTVEVYTVAPNDQDGTRRFYRSYTSPVYVLAEDANTNVADNTISPDIPIDPGINVDASTIGFARMTRATTATTGGCGGAIKVRN